MMELHSRPKKQPITFEEPVKARAVALRMPRISEDVRLFALTFLSGFLFTALFIA
ncbi:hypothetical protein [Sphingomicrobium clamense]|uniref:Uncharacterized protein n=1 Tax=Sphingomicrobium clamense TaxID=2851013 RepID=A0ABS6V6A9_9SPHN|nr:hypothetical protein [Sphingomicrobium sp. B8]MBW0144608.1 hypothetical protein [Sphingomicrobium sp. B8]